MAPYRTGLKLVEFFNQLGWHETYGQGFPSRHIFAESKIREANGTPKLDKVIQAAIDPRNFLGTAFSVDEAINYLNQFLNYDGYEIVKSGLFYKVQALASVESTVRKSHKYVPRQELAIDDLKIRDCAQRSQVHLLTIRFIGV